MSLKANSPQGTLDDKWTKYRSTMNLVAPNNKRRIDIIVVGTGLAGAAAAATLGELGYNVKVANRSFGGVQVSRTFYAKGQTGQQLLLGAYQALSRQISLGNVTMYKHTVWYSEQVVTEMYSIFLPMRWVLMLRLLGVLPNVVH